jgi:hypothetical protein
MNSGKTPDLGTAAAGNSVVQENTHMNGGNEVLGTCRVRMEVRADSPELKALLAEVTVDGLPYDCDYTDIEGSGLKTLIRARERECREDLRLSLDKLDDAELGLKCGSDDDTVQALAVGLLGDRIDAGRPGAFAALLAAQAAATNHINARLLQELFDKVVSPFTESVNRRGVKELTRLAGGGAADPVVTYLAKERLALLANRDADLQAIPGLPIADLVANLCVGRYAYDRAVKSAAKMRVRAETVGSGELAELLPFEWWQVDDYLNERGMQALGHIDPWQPSKDGTRWCREEVLPAIERTTARLYHRALNEFDGMLPDAQHNQMILEAGDEYAEAYLRFLEEKNQANEQDGEAP